MSKRKIIIITRDDENYRKDNPLGNLLKKVDSTLHTPSYLHSFDYIKTSCKNEEHFNEDLIKLLRYHKVKSLPELRDFFTKKICSRENWYTIPSDLINCQDNNNINLYDRIQYEDDEIFLLFYNRTKKSVNGNPALLLSLVCMDCAITNSDGIENLLYIHDEEFGIKENKLLVYNGETVPTADNQGILKELTDRGFTFVAAFKHEIGKGHFFDQILNCKFGKKQIVDEMKKTEENNRFSDFIQLQSEINKNLR